MKISIYTFTMGRDYYLNNLLNSIYLTHPGIIEIEHHICFQGVIPSKRYDEHWSRLPGIITHVWEENVGIAEGMNRVLPELDGDLIMKMDDDCKIVSNNFWQHIEEIARLKSNVVFSPYPVGLIRNPGGPSAISHEVIYSDSLDTFYTLRYVNHVGGFARISPGYTKNWKFNSDLISGVSGNEDVQFSNMCGLQKIKMAYLENAIIVEHQESTLGQHERYKEYFKDRF